MITITLDEFIKYHVSANYPPKSIVDKSRAEQIATLDPAQQRCIILPLENNLFEIRALDEYESAYKATVARKEKEIAARVVINEQIEAKANFLSFCLTKGLSEKEANERLAMVMKGFMPDIASRFGIKVERVSDIEALLSEEL